MPRKDADPARDLVEALLEQVSDAGGFDDLDEEQVAELALVLYPIAREKIPPTAAAPPVSGELERALSWLEHCLRKGAVTVGTFVDGGTMYELKVAVGGLEATGRADTFFGAIVRCKDDLKKQVSGQLADAQELVD